MLLASAIPRTPCTLPRNSRGCQETREIARGRPPTPPSRCGTCMQRQPELYLVSVLHRGRVTYLDGRERVQDIQLGQVQSRIVVDSRRILDDHKVQPSAPTWPASADTDLSAWNIADQPLLPLGVTNDELTDGLKLGAGFPQVLRLERSLAYPGGLSRSVSSWAQQRAAHHSRKLLPHQQCCYSSSLASVHPEAP